MNSGFVLYAMIAASGAVSSFLGTDEASKYIEAEPLFWARGVAGVVAATSLSMKCYMSEGFQNWKKKKEETAMWKKVDTGP